jgi:hypothetical protein
MESIHCDSFAKYLDENEWTLFWVSKENIIKIINENDLLMVLLKCRGDFIFDLNLK